MFSQHISVFPKCPQQHAIYQCNLQCLEHKLSRNRFYTRRSCTQVVQERYKIGTERQKSRVFDLRNAVSPMKFCNFPDFELTSVSNPSSMDRIITRTKLLGPLKCTLKVLKKNSSILFISVQKKEFTFQHQHDTPQSMSKSPKK